MNLCSFRYALNIHGLATIMTLKKCFRGKKAGAYIPDFFCKYLLMILFLCRNMTEFNIFLKKNCYVNMHGSIDLLHNAVVRLRM